jgi:trehalose synthase
MLRPLLSYVRGAGIDARWLVIQGSEAFFRITKRLHHALHGADGDGSPLGPRERRVYEETLRENALELAGQVRANDIVLLHDPQTAGLAPDLLRAGARVVWRCHIGADHRSEEVASAWKFLLPYLVDVDRLVFSRDVYVPEECDHERASVIQPSIDPFSAKNQELDEAAIRTILVHVGVIEGPPPAGDHHAFRRADGTPGRVEHRADLIRMGRAPSWETPLVVQVSRWDRLKDPAGVLEGFGKLVHAGGPGEAQLVLAGPNVHAVADDPEADQVFLEVLEAWRSLPHAERDRITLVSLPTADVEENGAIVNALQRHAAVVVQKSLREGFGLTVTEAMWKGRPLVASRVGGIQDQIEDGVSGLLIDDPSDLDAFAAALGRVLDSPALARQLGEAARERARAHFLGLRHLLQYADLLGELDG